MIADSGNWDIGVPALTTSLRGIVNCFVEVRTLDHAVHSGMFGGAVPDALTALVRLLATLHDDAGDVAVRGPGRPGGRHRRLPGGPVPRRGRPGSTGVELIGTGRITDRLWTKPALAVLGIDAPATGEAPNALVPAAQGQAERTAGAGRRPEEGVRGAPRPPGASTRRGARG